MSVGSWLPAYRRGLATAMVAGGNLDLSNERGQQLVASMAIRHSQAALDHGGLDLLASL